jgi:hypothetical protein
MKGIQLGYDQLDNGEKIYAKIPLKFYGKFISKITHQNIPDEKSTLKFYKYSSSFGNKYALKFHNFFYFKLNQDNYNYQNKKRQNKFNNNNTTNTNININKNDINKKNNDKAKELNNNDNKTQKSNIENNSKNDDNSVDEKNNDKIYRFNFEIAKKSKIINSINFEMNPLLKISLSNFLKLKYGNYHGSNNQPLLFNNLISNNKTQYDFSSIFPSMVPYQRFGFSFNKNFYNTSENNIHNLKLSFNKIFEYESNIKLSNILKSNYIFNFCSICNILFTNELIIKKSFVFWKKMKYNHIFSNYHIKSKIVDMSIEQKNNEINNGNNFYIQNISYFRLYELPILKYFDLTNKIMPYFSLESFFIPRKSTNFKDFFKFIYNFGVSLQLKENLFIDFSFLTGATKNITIKKKHLNSFRIKLSS